MRSRSSVVSITVLQAVEVYMSPLILGVGPYAGFAAATESLSGVLIVERLLAIANPKLFSNGLFYETQSEVHLCMFHEELRLGRRVGRLSRYLLSYHKQDGRQGHPVGSC